MGSPTDNKILNTAISHGVVSAATLAFGGEGQDLGASNAWRSIIADVATGDKNWAGIAPTYSWAGGVIADTVKMAGTEYPTTGQKRDLLSKVLPKWLFGAVDAAFFDSFGSGVQQVASGDSKVNKSPSRAVAKILGGKTIDEQKELQRQFKVKQLTAEQQRGARDILMQVSSGRMPQAEMVKQLKRLERDYYMSTDDIFNALATIYIKRDISKESMPMGKGTLPTDRAVMIHQQVYGDK
jgi:hypothetical protein